MLMTEHNKNYLLNYVNDKFFQVFRVAIQGIGSIADLLEEEGDEIVSDQPGLLCNCCRSREEDEDEDSHK